MQWVWVWPTKSCVVVVGVVFLFCSVCGVFRYTGVRDVKQLVSERVIFYSGCHQVC